MKHLLRSMTRVLVLIVGGLAPITGQAIEPYLDAMPMVINLGNSAVRFQVKLFGLARIVGQFERLTGKMVSSGGEGSCRVHMRIDVTRVNTNDAVIDAYLRVPGFFYTEKYPQIIFSSSRLVLGDNGLQQIVGDLSLHGTTKLVVFHIEATDSTSNPDKDTNGFQAKATIKRSEFGLNSLKHIVSDEVEIIVVMQAG
jgi:polyisoprenoid-binding protein YceI